MSGRIDKYTREARFYSRLVDVLVAGIILAIIVGVFRWVCPAEAQVVEGGDIYSTYHVVASDNEFVRYDPWSGNSWILACPGNAKSCAWEPIEVRP